MPSGDPYEDYANGYGPYPGYGAYLFGDDPDQGSGSGGGGDSGSGGEATPPSDATDFSYALADFLSLYSDVAAEAGFYLTEEDQGGGGSDQSNIPDWCEGWDTVTQLGIESWWADFGAQQAFDASHGGIEYWDNSGGWGVGNHPSHTGTPIYVPGVGLVYPSESQHQVVSRLEQHGYGKALLDFAADNDPIIRSLIKGGDYSGAANRIGYPELAYYGADARVDIETADTVFVTGQTGSSPPGTNLTPATPPGGSVRMKIVGSKKIYADGSGTSTTNPPPGYNGTYIGDEYYLVMVDASGNEIPITSGDRMIEQIGGANITGNGVPGSPPVMYNGRLVFTDDVALVGPNSTQTLWYPPNFSSGFSASRMQIQTITQVNLANGTYYTPVDSSFIHRELILNGTIQYTVDESYRIPTFQIPIVPPPLPTFP